ncbi:MAG: transcription termination factor NusA [Candidatus Campbellbacteria bacterium]|nr:transcription termination factor NusA [Candidatus Campbellbacteria bacterium]
MFDLKVINSVLTELEEERGIPRASVLEAIESALATAYKKEYGKKGQIIRAQFNVDSGGVEFFQVKIVVDESTVRVVETDETGEPIEETETNGEEEDERPRYNPEHHIFLEDAKKIKKDAEVGEEIVFPLEKKDDYGRIAAQTAKQVIIQKIREAEKVSVVDEFGEKEGTIVSGTVQRIERGAVFVDLGRTTGIIGWDDQIPGERFRQGERIRALLYLVEESGRGVFLRLSRSHPDFLKELFKAEAPEISTDVVEITAIAREPGSRSKVAVYSNDPNIDPVGSLVGQRGVRVSTVMSELGGEKIDIIEWSDNPHKFIEDALSPASVLSVELDEEEGKAFVEVSTDQQSLAIGKGGQNVRLAARLTGWKIEIHSVGSDEEVEAAPDDTIKGNLENIPGKETAATEETTEEVEEEAIEAESTEEDEEETGAKEETETSSEEETETASEEETASEDAEEEEKKEV